MGIKFQCPNGHSLNVKTFLAGKRGVCPDCGVTFRIPSESMPSTRAEPIGAAADAVPESVVARQPTAVPSAASSSNGRAGQPYQPASVVPAQAAPVAASLPYAASSTIPSGVPLPAAGAIPTARPAAPGVVPVGVPVGTPAPYGQPAVMPAAADPINESPLAIWYIRPPSGGQYGPARGDVMRNWLAEGRVSGDSLVWREGWTDWRSASQVFPQLAGGPSYAAGPMPAAAALPAATASSSTAANDPAAAGPRSTRTTARYSARKKSGSGLAIAALVGLVVVCVVLVGVLVVVLNR